MYLCKDLKFNYDLQHVELWTHIVTNTFGNFLPLTLLICDSFVAILEFSVEYNGSTNSECDLEFRF